MRRADAVRDQVAPRRLGKGLRGR